MLPNPFDSHSVRIGFPIQGHTQDPVRFSRSDKRVSNFFYREALPYCHSKRLHKLFVI